MRPTFLGFEASKTGIFASQKALDVTGQNLSNISTNGYTRQRVDQIALSAGSYASRYHIKMSDYAGMGTSVNGVQQIRDKRLDMAFRSEYSNSGYFDQKTTMLEDVQSVLQELDDGDKGNGFSLRASFEELYTSLQDFSANANSETHANIVASAFSNISKVLNQVNNNLENSALSFKSDLKIDTTELNSTLKKIADLNITIRNSMVSNNYTEEFGPNELIDQRNLLLDDLSKYGEVSIKEVESGMIDVSLGGHNVVKEGESEGINMIESNNGTVSLLWRSTGENVDAGTGSLKAAVDVLNGKGTNVYTPTESIERGFLYYKDKLNSFASMLADVANSTIPDTFAADGSILTYKKILGADMGEGNTSTTLPVTAANITISKELSKDSSYLIYDKKSKDNTYILSMIQQFTTDKHQFETTGDRFTGTFEDFINDYNSTLGSDINHCTTRMDASTTMLTEIMNTRDSVSGVSESEETANMLMYNRSFQAASRMLNTMDGLLDVIINKMGV